MIFPASTRIQACCVRVIPGLTAKTRMPDSSRPHSTASAWVSATRPAFEALYGERNRVVFFELTEAMWTRTPCASFNCG